MEVGSSLTPHPSSLGMLSLESLTAGYGGAPALCEFSLQVASGQIAAVIGPNGCGKSTLLRCVAGLVAPSGGRVRLDEDDVALLPPRERARRVALLPQHFVGGDELSVEAMALLGRTPYLAPYGAPSPHDCAVAARALQATDAAGLSGRRVAQLSGGERQRVMLARALAQQPRVLLLDEPTSNLDIRYQYEILDAIRRLARSENLAVVLVLHQINLAAAVADVMALLNSSGTTRACGTPEQVMTQENLEAVYQTPLIVAAHPQSGRPQARSAWVFQ